ncbi:MAG: glycerophosphodiester phosphodiesterase family protein, partial [Actinomycetes bacterium]
HSGGDPVIAMGLERGWRRRQAGGYERGSGQQPEEPGGQEGASGAGTTIVMAHRGGARGLGENTIPAFRAALGAGAGGLESDAWLTADGVVVLDHDGIIGVPGRRRRLGSVECAGLPGRLPSLAGLYAACGTAFQLSLDLRDPAALPEVVRVAARAGGLDRLWLCHGDATLL